MPQRLFSRDEADRMSKFPTPRQLNPKVPDELSKLVMECVRMLPKDRPSDMAQILPKLIM